MANLFEAQTDELCYISVEDVRDSLGGVFALDADPLISDAEIEALIIEAQNQVNTYLNGINPDIPCSGVVDHTIDTSSCVCSQYTNGLLTSCEDVPINIKRATLQLVDNIYTENTVDDGIDPTAETMAVGDIVREKTACGKEVEYYTGTKCCGEEERTACWLVDCKSQLLLNCYEKKSGSINICAKSCCGNACKNICNNCTKCA